MASVIDKIDKIFASRDAPQVKDLVERIIKKMGGMEGLVDMIWQEFTEAPPGGLIRQRMLSIILDNMRFTNKNNPTVDDLSLLSDEDLKAETYNLFAKVGNELSAAGVLQQGRPGEVQAVVPQAAPAPG